MLGQLQIFLLQPVLQVAFASLHGCFSAIQSGKSRFVEVLLLVVPITNVKLHEKYVKLSSGQSQLTESCPSTAVRKSEQKVCYALSDWQESEQESKFSDFFDKSLKGVLCRTTELPQTERQSWFHFSSFTDVDDHFRNELACKTGRVFFAVTQFKCTVSYFDRDQSSLIRSSDRGFCKKTLRVVWR